MRALIILGLAASLLGCESRSYKELRLKHEALKIEHERVLDQMNKIWQQSLKSRFPLILPFEADKQLDVQKAYVKSIKFSPAQHVAHRWRVEVTHLTDKKDVHPNYVVYLFDRRGLNIGKLRVDPKKWVGLKERLEQGKESTVSREIELDFPETPRYFWIKWLE